jgi:hypothetical protein
MRASLQRRRWHIVSVGWPVLAAAMAAFLAAYCLVLWRFAMNGHEKGLVRGFLRSRGR